jgi:hypothetical protein
LVAALIFIVRFLQLVARFSALVPNQLVAELVLFKAASVQDSGHHSSTSRRLLGQLALCMIHIPHCNLTSFCCCGI